MDRKLGVMLDCSRNAVMSVPALKRFITLVARMGYNRILLYTEDTYEIKGEPLFGYLRGRYSGEEIKEIDKFCISLGVELLPCIQTLAHLNQIFSWNKYAKINDVNDILLVDEEKTYELIDKMFKTCAENFTCRKIHIGMDEAHKLGLGKYLDRNGFVNRSELFLKHLGKVCEIAEKYGFQPMMWSDMFFSLAFGKYYVFDNEEVPEEVKKLVPKNIELVYWDYYTNKEEQYVSMLEKHLSFNRSVSFAGGAWKWEMFTPLNATSIPRNESAIRACNKLGVKDIMITLWGDNGFECPANAVLPTLVHAAECAKGNYGLENAKEKFLQIVGVPWDDFMLFDMYLPDSIPKSFPKANGIKTMFYNDCLVGRYDSSVIGDGSEGKAIADIGKQIAFARKHAGRFAYLFDYYAKLAEFMEIKYDLGYRSRMVYKNGNKKQLKNLIKDYGVAIKRLDAFYEAFKVAWYTDNKAFGFEVTDIRLGGVKQRLTHAKDVLTDYLKGKIDHIEELEVELVEFDGVAEVNKKVPYAFSYSKSSSTNRII